MRDNHAQLAGWRVLRITYRMLKGNPQMVRDMIRRALPRQPEPLEALNLKAIRRGFRGL